MNLSCIKKTVHGKLRCYRDDMRGSLSVELVFVLPLLLWAYIAIVVFNDAYRARMEGQSAALNVADMISRNTDELTVDYLEGMNDVFDFLTTRNRETRLRISSIMWDVDSEYPNVVWSYGTRDLPSLLDLLGTAGDGTTSLGSINDVQDTSDPDADIGTAFDLWVNQLSVENLVDRIPPVLPGEALILVESFSFWESPLTSLMGLSILNSQRLAPLAVTRPRFSPFIRFELDNEIFPEGPPETVPTVGEIEEPAEPEEEEEPEPESTTVTIVDTEFSSGETENWSADTITNSSGNNFLGPFGQETRTNPVTYNVNLGGESKTARIEFDLLIIDSWDGYDPTWARPEGEHLMILVNGSSIDAQAFQDGLPGNMALARHSVASRAEGHFTTHMELIQSGSNVAGAHWHDQIWRVTIDIENPAQNFTLGFSANLDEPVNNESFGFTNFRVTAERGSHGPAHFVPSQTFLAKDQYNQFDVFSGCPDHRIAAQTHTLRVQDLQGGLRHRVRARGERRLRDCPGFNNTHHGVVHASPNIVLNFDRQNNTSSDTRLRIRTDDGNSGRTCDSNLLVRDRFGEWSYHRDIQTGWPSWLRNYNAQISMGHAGTGEYHIWVLTDSVGACNVDLIFESH